jgi:hypothetical protein
MRPYRHKGIVAAMLTLSVLCAAGSAANDADVAALKSANIPTDAGGLTAYFKRHTLTVSNQARIRALVRQLGDDAFKKREEASRQLVLLGAHARTFLEAAVKDPDPEIARRARNCLERIAQGKPAASLSAAVRVLARLHPPQAAAVLLDYLPSAGNDAVAEAIEQALPSLAARDGKTEAALLDALNDKSPLKRAAAAGALCSARGTPEVLERVRKLLHDRDPRVRARAGLGLATLRDKDAVPVLIRLLDELPWRDTDPIMTLLERLAGASMPAVVYGPDAAAHRKYREAWEAWWNERGPKIEPEQLERATKPRGFTTVVLLDANTIEDLDDANRVRWKIENLSKPLDVQLLPGEERVLIAEHDVNCVGERNLKGEIVWKRNILGPLAAQRLPNGNTFITTRNQLLEFDKKGQEVFAYSRPDNSWFMRATKLRDGDIACIVSMGGPARYVRLTPAGNDFKDVKSWGVQVTTSGGRVEVLANGHVLIPEMNENRVVEFDADGRSVWEAKVEQPITALRLPNGHTMVTLMGGNGALELDRTGKQVWQYKAPDSRVTRALRR